MVLVGCHVGGKLRDGDVIVVEEVRLGLESRLRAFLCCLLENAVVDLALKGEAVGRQAIMDILCHGERVELSLVVLHVVEDDMLATFDDELNDHALHLRSLHLRCDRHRRLC